jgi:hypothetical protein
VKVLNPSNIGRYPVHLHKFPANEIFNLPVFMAFGILFRYSSKSFQIVKKSAIKFSKSNKAI